MCEAILRGLLDRGVVRGRDVVVAEISSERRQELAETFGVATTIHGVDAVAEAEVVILAVKPQHLSTVLEDLRQKTPSDTLVLSIVAGARLSILVDGLDHRVVVRAMPNTPAQVGKATTVWTATSETDDEQRELARTILGGVGFELEVATEALVEAATGISAPAPAFVYLLVEAMSDAAVALGFNAEQAQQLVLESFRGSLELQRVTGEHPAILRSHVTSPGGATAAGLYALERGRVRTAIHDAVRAVFDRAQILGASVDDRP